ncbi:substrate-binding domain-containing protein [Bradyrhizobium sp. SEMIA]|uniref:substrate-binding domain-containing protein n=1 Tax=Bradyrhizobium sp. SEMIA TaxID=2597515 RepID=UPI0018A613A3|nr:substrate-binding domain-containing protein [Bradyrhizobium sp. SEMIA]QOG17244.1 extracellular solute-binding protein [Bradyrhizobium sp. SEMIA]
MLLEVLIVPRHVVCLFAVLIAVLFAPGARAADLKVMISAGFFNVYKELGPAFEASTGHKLVTTRGPSIGDSPEAIPTRLARGEDADAVIMDGVGVDLLDKRELTRPGSRIQLAQSFIGMVVRAGQPKPDISTMDSLRKTLLAAKSIAYSDSSSGTYLSTVGFKKLGVADEIAGKTRKVPGPPSGEPVAAVVARGEAEIGFQQVAELMHVPGVDLAGTVPAEIQPPTYYVGALPKNSQHPEAAIALLNFLSSADAAAAITKAGLKPLPAH